jgi:hypothetical protein
MRVDSADKTRFNTKEVVGVDESRILEHPILGGAHLYIRQGAQYRPELIGCFEPIRLLCRLAGSPLQLSTSISMPENYTVG